MGCHQDRIASGLSCSVDYGLIGMRVFNMQPVARHSRRRGDVLRCLEIFGAHRIDTSFVPLRLVDHFSFNEKIWNGSDTVTMVTLALRAFANSVPCSMAFCDSSDPSVGIRICLYICSSLKPPESCHLTSLSRLYAIGNCIAAAMKRLGGKRLASIRTSARAL